MTLALAALLLVNGEGLLWRAQEETGVPIVPYTGLEGGIAYARFPDEWGLADASDSGWCASVVLGGAALDNGPEIMLRFTYRHWDELEVDEANERPLAEPVEARVQGALVDAAFDMAVGPLRVGLLAGGGLYLLKHRFDREVAPTGELGVYVRFKPVAWLYVEGGLMTGIIRGDFNGDNTYTVIFTTAHAVAGVEFRF